MVDEESAKLSKYFFFRDGVQIVRYFRDSEATRPKLFRLHADASREKYAAIGLPGPWHELILA